jgi:hypothetical protein
MADIEFFDRNWGKTVDSQDGSPCVRVQITFEQDDRSITEYGLIDTGRNLTMVHQQAVLGLSPDYQSTSDIANGPMPTPIYKATICIVGETTPTPIFVGVIKDGRLKILLGRDFLKPFIMLYDQRHQLFTLNLST